MKTIITEEMRFRQRVVEYAIKYNKPLGGITPADNKFNVGEKDMMGLYNHLPTEAGDPILTQISTQKKN